VTRPQRLAAGVLMLTTLSIFAAACGSVSTGGAGAGQPTPITSIPMATSLGGPGQAGWAVVPMGGSAASENNFWELFTRPAGSAQWQLATPLGVASNGGILMTPAGGGLVAGFGPSQDLTFSPLAVAASPGAAWSQNAAPVNPGLASVPDALASGPGGQMLALTRGGEVLSGTADGAAWARLATLRAIAGSRAGRACGLAALTAVGFTAAGAPEVGGACTRPGAAAIFVRQADGDWQPADPMLANTALAGDRATALGLTTHAGRTTALIYAWAQSRASVVAAWSATGTGNWAVSSPIGVRTGRPRSLQMWADGSAALVLADGRGVTIAGPGASWRPLPALPARTVTLALGQADQMQALTADGQRFAVWQLTAGAWRQAQRIAVQIPYGSSS
jgi:hypothetical protein